MRDQSGFDKLARHYEWMERLSFGGALHRCRLTYLRQLVGARRVLVLGDGDGRFTAALLRVSPAVTVEAVDGSPAMLRQLEHRVQIEGNASRLDMRLADLREWVPDREAESICSHFFLDCLAQAEVERVTQSVAKQTRARNWVVSEFAVPAGSMRLPSTILVGLLYLAFRVVTGLHVRRLPDHASALRQCGFFLREERKTLGGLLVAQWWTLKSGEDA